MKPIFILSSDSNHPSHVLIYVRGLIRKTKYHSELYLHKQNINITAGTKILAIALRWWSCGCGIQGR